MCHQLGHCWSICSPPAAAAADWKLIKRELECSFVAPLRPWAVLHSCTTVTGSIQGYRFACRHPLPPPPFPTHCTSLSNSPIKTHLGSLPPSHTPSPRSTELPDRCHWAAFPPQPPLCNHPHPPHLALRTVGDLGAKAGRQAALLFLPLTHSPHSGHCLHSSCVHSADWAPR